MAIVTKVKPPFPPNREGTPWAGREERKYPPPLEVLILKCWSFDAWDRPTAEQALDILLAIEELDHPDIAEDPQRKKANVDKEREKKAD